MGIKGQAFKYMRSGASTALPGELNKIGKRAEVSILVASSNAMAGELLAGALNRHSKFRVVANVTTVNQVLQSAKSEDLDVALINATLADSQLSGFEALRQLRDSRPEVKSVILFDSPDRQLVVDAFRVGAKGVFCRSQSAFKTLCRCVSRVHAGQIWANSSELADVMEAFSQLAPIRMVKADGLRLLTKREEDVVHLLAEGMQNREIASELNLSEHTIKNYLFHIFDKLGVSSRVELVLYAVSSANRMRISSVNRGGQGNEAAAFALIPREDPQTPIQTNVKNVSQKLRRLTPASDILSETTVPTPSVN